MKKFALGVFWFIAAPYVCIWERMRFGVKKRNSGHTAGLGDGFEVLLAGISGMFQIVLLSWGLLIYFLCK